MLALNIQASVRVLLKMGLVCACTVKGDYAGIWTSGAKTLCWPRPPQSPHSLTHRSSTVKKFWAMDPALN
jgi:hypothetical protein